MARSEVIRWIKQNMVMYLAAGQNPISFDSQAKDKLLRGLNSLVTGCLLIPAKHILEWDVDPKA